MFEILTGKAQAGGTLEFQKGTLERAKKDLEKQLNALNSPKVHAFSVYKEDGEVHIIAVAEYTPASKKQKSK